MHIYNSVFNNKTEKLLIFQLVHLKPFLGGPQEEVIQTQGCLELQLSRRCPEGKGRGGVEFGTDQRVISETGILTGTGAEVQSNINE